MKDNDRDIILGWIGGFVFGVIFSVTAIALWLFTGG